MLSAVAWPGRLIRLFDVTPFALLVGFGILRKSENIGRMDAPLDRGAASVKKTDVLHQHRRDLNL